MYWHTLGRTSFTDFVRLSLDSGLAQVLRLFLVCHALGFSTTSMQIMLQTVFTRVGTNEKELVDRA
jgi:hypothetical protein